MLTERQKKIMIAVIEAYTENNEQEPIGSNTLTQMEGLDFSSATLRNEMAALEEMGYLEKTHTSSGRVPTELGYRVYVDELMNIDVLADEVEEQVQSFMENSKLPKLEAATSLLKTAINSADFNYGAIVLEKTAFNSRIRKIDFVDLHHQKGVFIMVTDKGLVLSKEARIPDGFDVRTIEKTVEYLDVQLKDMLLNDFKNLKLKAIFVDDFFDYMSNAGSVVELVLRNISKLVDDKKQIIGQYNILHHPDFADINLAQEYLDRLKDESLYQMVEFDSGPIPVISGGGGLVTIKIGSSNNLNILKKCSTITAYFQSGADTGAITVFGPMRMKYRYIIALLKGIINCL